MWSKAADRLEIGDRLEILQGRKYYETKSTRLGRV